MSQPRPMCVEHGAQMIVEECGVFVQINADFGPYEVWSGDVQRCPVGGERVVLGYGQTPVIQHWQEKFTAWLDRVTIIEGEGERKRAEGAR